MLHGDDQRIEHLVDRHEAAASRALPQRGQLLGEPVDRRQRTWPLVARPQHVPRPHHRRAQPLGFDVRLAALSCRLIRAHDRRGVCDAHVDEVRDAGRGRGISGGIGRHEVHALELRRLGRTGIWRADQVHEGVRGRNEAGEGARIEGVSDHRLRTGGQPALGARAHEPPHGMTAREQPGDESAADVSRAAGDEDVGHAVRWGAP